MAVATVTPSVWAITSRTVPIMAAGVTVTTLHLIGLATGAAAAAAGCRPCLRVVAILAVVAAAVDMEAAADAGVAADMVEVAGAGGRTNQRPKIATALTAPRSLSSAPQYAPTAASHCRSPMAGGWSGYAMPSRSGPLQGLEEGRKVTPANEQVRPPLVAMSQPTNYEERGLPVTAGPSARAQGQLDA